jgi:hypothetical protein
VRWPWRRRRLDEEHRDSGRAARKAKADAEAALRAAEKRWPEVQHAKNVFAAEVEQAWAKRRRQA